MATPTSKPAQSRPSGPFTPSGGGSAASPSHLSSKTLTRSPAAVRTRAGTLSRMEHSASQQGHTPGSYKAGSSPAPMMGTPSAGHGIGHILGATPPAGSVGMTRGGSIGLGVHGLSGMGSALDGSADGIGIVSDKELIAKGKIREIVALLKDEWGYVSRSGIQRAAGRLKLEHAWETGPEDEPGVLDVAGEGFIVAIKFRRWQVIDVTLEFMYESGATGPGAGSEKKEDDVRGAEILKRDLQGWNREKEKGEYVKLRRFGENMEYLGAIDNLGKGGVNCFGAIDGIYRAFKQVEAWWLGRADVPEAKDRFQMLTSGLGWPRMHANGHVGLVFSYWLHRWQTKRALSESFPTYLEPPTDTEHGLYSLRIGVDTIDATMPVEPIKISSDWFEFHDDLPGEDEMELALRAQFPPWQLKEKIPDPTYVPVAEEPGSNAMEVDGQAPSKPLPSVIFKASFEPGLPIGWFTTIQELLIGKVGIVAQSTMVPVPYLQLVLPDHDALAKAGGEVIYGDAGDTTPVQFNKDILGQNGQKERLNFSLTGGQMCHAHAMTEFPFSHPMELLTALPTLRMWAFLHCLFTRSFGPKNNDTESSGTTLDAVGLAGSQGKAGEATANLAKSKQGAKKLRLRDLTAKEYRARLKAGLQIPTDDSDTSDNEANVKSSASQQKANVIEIAMEFPNNAQFFRHVNLDITIPIDEHTDPVVAFLSVQPGPQVVVRDASEGDKFAIAMAKVLLVSEDFEMLVRWVWEKKRVDKMEE